MDIIFTKVQPDTKISQKQFNIYIYGPSVYKERSLFNKHTGLA